MFLLRSVKGICKLWWSENGAAPLEVLTSLELQPSAEPIAVREPGTNLSFPVSLFCKKLRLSDGDTLEISKVVRTVRLSRLAPEYIHRTVTVPKLDLNLCVDRRCLIC